MHDHNRSTTNTPRNWSDAFAALPLETPDAGAWQRVQHARRPRRAPRWPKWTALAAVLAVAAVLPWQQLRPERAADAPDASATGTVAQGRTARAPAAAPAVAVGTTPHAGSTELRQAATAEGAASSGARIATRTPRTELDRAERVARARSRASSLRTSEALDSGVATAVPAPAMPAVAQPDAGASLESLYAQSAQLEALLALARDDRVATGAAAALSDAYDTQMASIDAALREPALTDDARNALWQQRVETLRQFAGFESTQRALAASGERYDAMLVSID